MNDPVSWPKAPPPTPPRVVMRRWWHDHVKGHHFVLGTMFDGQPYFVCSCQVRWIPRQWKPGQWRWPANSVPGGWRSPSRRDTIEPYRL